MVICNNVNVIGVKRIEYTNKNGKFVVGARVSLCTPRIDANDGSTAFVVWHSNILEARRAFDYPDDYYVTVHKGKFGVYAVFHRKDNNADSAEEDLPI